MYSVEDLISVPWPDEPPIGSTVREKGRTMTQATAIEIAHDAYVATDAAVHYWESIVTAILTFGDEFFALGDEYDDGEFAGYSWAWGVETHDEFGAWGTTTETFGEDGGTTEAEAREAVAKWIATVTK